MIENVHSMYNAPSIYNQGGAKPVVIPNDVTLYNKLVQTANAGNFTQCIKIYFPKRITNKDNTIGVIAEFNASNVGNEYSIESLDYYPRKFWIRPFWAYLNNDATQISNGGAYSTSIVPGGINFLNKRVCLEVTNREYRNGFNGNLYGMLSDNEFGVTAIGGFFIPTSNYPNNAPITLERIYIRQANGIYLADCRPAVKGGKPGLYDIISGNFGTATDTSVWDVQDQIIY